MVRPDQGSRVGEPPADQVRNRRIGPTPRQGADGIEQQRLLLFDGEDEQMKKAPAASITRACLHLICGGNRRSRDPRPPQDITARPLTTPKASLHATDRTVAPLLQGPYEVNETVPTMGRNSPIGQGHFFKRW